MNAKHWFNNIEFCFGSNGMEKGNILIILDAFHYTDMCPVHNLANWKMGNECVASSLGLDHARNEQQRKHVQLIA